MFLVLVFVGGGLLAPWVWWLAHGLARVLPGDWARVVVNHPFHRYVHRCLLLVAVAGIWPLARGLGCRTLRDVGLSRGPRDGQRFLVAAALGAGSLAVVLVLELVVGARKWGVDVDVTRVMLGVLRSALTGVMVALIE